MEKFVPVLVLVLLTCGPSLGQYPVYSGNVGITFDGGAQTMTAVLGVFTKLSDNTPSGTFTELAVVDSTSLVPYAKTGDCTSATKSLTIIVNTATDVITSGTGCNIVVNTPSTHYAIYVRAFTSVVAEDTVFTITTYGISVTSTEPARTQAFVPISTNNFGGNMYSTLLEVVDPNNGYQVTAGLDLGKAFVLQVTMTINNYQADVDYAGANVHTCSVADNTGFTGAVQFVGVDACWDDTAIFRTTDVDSGFSRTDAESGLSGGTKTYVARSPDVESSAFTNIVDFYGARSLYFTCILNFCYDDTGNTQGTCGQNHCANGRRKRSVLSNDTVVMTSVDIIRAPRKDSGRPCPSTMTFQGTIVGLGAIVVTLAILTSINVVSLRTANAKMRERRRANVDFYVTAGSQVSLKPSSVSGKSSSRITSVSSDRSDRKC